MAMAGIRMIISKSGFSLILLLTCSWIWVGKSEEGSGSGSGSGTPLLCLQKLMVCQPLLKGGGSGGAPPPTACCDPLKTMLEQDSECTCAVFDNEELLKGFNATKDDGIKLAKSCGATPNLSACQSSSSSQDKSCTTTTASHSYIGGRLTMAMAMAFATAILILPSFYF